MTMSLPTEQHTLAHGTSLRSRMLKPANQAHYHFAQAVLLPHLCAVFKDAVR